MPKVEFNEVEVVYVSPILNVTDSFQKRELVVSTGGDYPEPVQIEVMSKMFDRLNNVAAGATINCSAWVGGRSWQKSPSDPVRYFNSLKLAYIEVVSPATVASEAAKDAQPEQESDDLPF